MIQITNPKDCCGCTACASICAHRAISMEPDKEGFLYPIIDVNSCTNCGLCETVCPILQRKGQKLLPNQIQYKALRLKDKRLLMKSSSGGAFIAIATFVIDQGGIVCGAKYTNETVVVHDFAETKREIEEFMGSKYSQSDIRGIFPKIKAYLKAGRLVLFTGTPCQVQGLNLYLRKKYNNLLTADLICHAVPSPLIFKDYISYCSTILGSPIKKIDMRYKEKYGWSHKYAYRFQLKDGTAIVDPKKIENWGKLFFSQLIDRPSCHECKFTNYNRCGDLTIADYWDDNNKRTDIYSREGTSLCLVNTQKGEQILKDIDNTIISWNISKEETEQPRLLRATPVNPQRDEFWKYYLRYGFAKSYKKYFTLSPLNRIKKNVKLKIKDFLGEKKVKTIKALISSDKHI